MAETPQVRITGEVDASLMRVGVVVSTFNEPVTSGLLEGALQVLEAARAREVTVVEAPGAFELPLIAQRLARAGYDCVVALGAVILGETDHYEHIAHRASEGLQRVALENDVPVAFGVLTVRDPQHAVARSRDDDHNKGAEAARAAIIATSVGRAILTRSREIEAKERQASRRV